MKHLYTFQARYSEHWGKARLRVRRNGVWVKLGRTIYVWRWWR